LSNWNINHLLQLYFIQFGQSFSFRFVSFRLAALSKSTGPCEPLVSRSTIDWLQVKDIFEKVVQWTKRSWEFSPETHPHAHTHTHAWLQSMIISSYFCKQTTPSPSKLAGSNTRGTNWTNLKGLSLSMQHFDYFRTVCWFSWWHLEKNESVT
jgi:hypothetical protein